MGSEFGHFLAMKGRLLPMAVTVIGAIAIITIALPAGHELGHYLTARAFSVPVEQATWTLLERTPPSVRYREATASAQAWIAAGGVLLPTTVGVLILLLWLRFSVKVPAQMRVLWLVLGCGYALNGTGPTLDLVAGRFSRLQRLAVLFQLERLAAVSLHLAPMVAALGIIGVVFRHAHRGRLTARSPS